MAALTRRHFLKSSSTLAAAAATGGGLEALLPVPSQAAAVAAQPQPLAAAASRSAGAQKLIGIQIPAVSFIDEGVNQVLDIVQERAKVNTLFLTVLAFNNGLAGRQLKGFALPDHGKQAYDDDFRGGYYAALHAKYHQNPLYKEFRAPDHGNFDVLASVLPEAKKRGLKTIVFLADNLSRSFPNVEKLQEVDLHGKHTGEVCINNHVYRGLLQGIIEDCTRSYDIDGLLYRSERGGPLNKTLGLNHFSPSPAVCFCNFCRAKAKKQGLNLDRVRTGYGALEKFVAESRAGKRPTDGYFVTFWRLLLKHPETLAWHTFQTESLRELYQVLYKQVKGIKDIPVGWAVAANNNLNPMYRADQDLQTLTPYSDFLKVVMYNNVGGPRMKKIVDNMGSAIMADVPKEQLLEWNYAVLNLQERGYSQIAYTGFSSDFMYREAQRAKQGVADTDTQIWAGIDVDLPTEEAQTKATPDSIKNAILAAFKGGVDGVVLARKYSEMRLTSLSGVGAAVNELGLG